MIPEIVVGWQKGELLPNYDPDIPLDLVQRLNEKVRTNQAEGFPTAKEAKQRIRELKERGYQEISVSGVWTHNCVAAAIYDALYLGLNVQANEEDTFNVLGLSLEESVAQACDNNKFTSYHTIRNNNSVYFKPV